jgi:hypothetical protein
MADKLRRNWQTVPITSTSEYIVDIEGFLSGDLLFVNCTISKDLPAGSFQSLPILIPLSNTIHHAIIALGGNLPSGAVTYGTQRDKDKVVSARISNTSITVCANASMNADFYVSFICPYPPI